MQRAPDKGLEDILTAGSDALSYLRVYDVAITSLPLLLTAVELTLVERQ